MKTGMALKKWKASLFGSGCGPRSAPGSLVVDGALVEPVESVPVGTEIAQLDDVVALDVGRAHG